MPYKDREKNAASIKQAIEKNYISACNVRFRKDDAEFYDALQSGSKAEGITVAEYLRTSAKENLIRDGYLSNNQN